MHHFRFEVNFGQWPATSICLILPWALTEVFRISLEGRLYLYTILPSLVAYLNTRSTNLRV